MKSYQTIPVWPLLCAVLIVLKLCGVIGIGWLAVFAPIWAPIAFYLSIMTLAAIISFILR